MITVYVSVPVVAEVLNPNASTAVVWEAPDPAVSRATESYVLVTVASVLELDVSALAVAVCVAAVNTRA